MVRGPYRKKAFACCCGGFSEEDQTEAPSEAGRGGGSQKDVFKKTFPNEKKKPTLREREGPDWSCFL